MKKLFFIAVFALSFNAGATVSWTVVADGMLANSSGSVAVKLGSEAPKSPNPSGSTWQNCKHNVVYFHRSIDGTKVKDLELDRMFKVAAAAAAMKHELRLAIDIDDKGYCLTQQIYDLGR